MRTSAADLPRLRRDEPTDTQPLVRAFTYTPHPAAGAKDAPIATLAASHGAPPAKPLWDRRYRAGPDSLDWHLPAMRLALAWPNPEPIRASPATPPPPPAPLADETEILASLEALDATARSGESAPAPSLPAFPLPHPHEAPPQLAPGLMDAPAPVAERVFAPAPLLNLSQTEDLVPPPLHPPEITDFAEPTFARAPFGSPAAPEPSKAAGPTVADGEAPEALSWYSKGGYAETWLSDKALPDQAEPLQVQERPRQRRVRYAVAAIAVLAAIAAAAVAYQHNWSRQEETALFNAPMMVIKAAGPGRVAAIAVTPGQTVQPASVLLSLQDGPLQRKPILSGVNGVIRSVEVQPGVDVTRGSPLIRLYDCDHAFLTLPQGAKISAGQPIRVSITGQTPFSATVRASSGVAEPVNAVVVGVPIGALSVACPVGATARVEWDGKASG